MGYMGKSELRKTMTARRRNFSGNKRVHADARIADRVKSLPEWKRAHTVCVYVSLPNEVDTKALILESGKKIVYPDRTDGEKIDIFIVPGVAFDRMGNRLGRGGGYYDKLLAGVPSPKIGLAYSFQVLAEVPRTSYDVPMDMVVTEVGIYENKAS